MIKQTSLNFLTELKNTNTREWFEQNKVLYQTYKDDVIQFSEKLWLELARNDLSLSNAHLVSKKCLTRVNKDLRFSKDNTPYKNYVLM